jgi:hypothetical protein
LPCEGSSTAFLFWLHQNTQMQLGFQGKPLF